MEQDIWFWSDPHFLHDAIIDYCNRPWKNAHSMDRAQIANYKEVIKPSSTVYVLGDFTIKTSAHRGRVEQIIRQLPGKKVLILGNHDYFKPFTYVEMGFWGVHTSLELESLNMTLAHDPAVAEVNRRKLFVCGHVHTLFKTQRNVINVGVDVNNFYPQPLSEIEVIRQQMITEGVIDG